MSKYDVTDWISCTTPPVRDGEYEINLVDSIDGIAIRRGFENGDWIDGEGIKLRPDMWKWRGVRRWVLTVRDFLNGHHTYVAHVSTRGTLYLTDKLHNPIRLSAPYSEALSFVTEREAVAYADKHSRHLRDWKAVQP